MRLPALKGGPWRLVASCGLVLSIFLIGIRAAILTDDLAGLWGLDWLATVALASRQDLLLTLTVVVLGLILVRDRGFGTSMFTAGSVAFLLLCNVILLLGAGNILAIRHLGEPPTLAWLLYADLFRSTYAFTAIGHALGDSAIAQALALLVAYTGLTIAAAFALRTVVTNAASALMVAALPGLLSMAALGMASENATLDRGKLSNPARAFGASLLGSGAGSDIAGDGQMAGATAPFSLKTAAPPPRPGVEPGEIRNAILFVLHSVPAKHVEGFEGALPATPELRQRAAQGLRFRNAYSHTPGSNGALFSLLAASVPPLPTRPPSGSYPHLAFDGIATVLDLNGFRTGFFNAADNRFQGTESFVARAGFETVADQRSWSCDAGIYGGASLSRGYREAPDDLCTVRQALSWIDAASDEPFFLTVTTGMTRYPYFVAGTAEPLAKDPDLNRYLNALKASDAAFGRLMAHLETTGLAESTLVIVVGDHGVSLDGHRPDGRASSLREENLKVPLLLLHPALAPGESDIVVGLADVAPTVLDLVGTRPPRSWQGRSVFLPARPDAVLFHAPWNGGEIGFRDGATKLVYNAATGRARLHDLADDPEGLVDLAASEPKRLARARDLLGRWIASAQAGAGQPGNGSAAPIRRGIVLYASGTRYLTPPQAEILLDGQSIGVIDVTGAPENETDVVPPAEIAAASAAYWLRNGGNRCARRLEIRFLNDEWEGENQTGDTNLHIRGIEVDGVAYWPDQFQLGPDGGGSMSGDFFALWREASLTVELRVPPGCQGESLVENQQP